MTPRPPAQERAPRMPRKLRIWRRVGIAASGAAVLLISMVTSVAARASTPSTGVPIVHFQFGATVRGGGAGAVVTLSISCPGIHDSQFEISAEQPRPDGTIAAASGYASLTNCNRTVQTIRVPLCSGCPGENSDFGGSGAPLHPGKAQGAAFLLYTDASNNEIAYYYPLQPISLVNSPRLDHPAAGGATLQPQGRLIAGGAAADLYVSAACHSGVPAFQPPPPYLFQLTLYQTSNPSFVQSAAPFFPLPTTCHAPATYRLRVYPNLSSNVQPAPALRTRTAFVISGSLWGQITLF